MPAKGASRLLSALVAPTCRLAGWAFPGLALAAGSAWVSAAMIKPPACFETARLAARIPCAADAPAVFAAYASDPEVTKYLTWKPHTEVASLARFLQEKGEAWNTEKGQFTWLLSLRGADSPIGSIGFNVDHGKVLFGYVLAKRHWGQGLMGEALRWLVDWALAQPEIFRAWARCDVENPASMRVMEKAGMQREGRLRRWSVHPNLGPELRDCMVYSKIR
jgi:RimJ/RimL family protein N-acetyltransferase